MSTKTTHGRLLYLPCVHEKYDHSPETAFTEIRHKTYPGYMNKTKFSSQFIDEFKQRLTTYNAMVPTGAVGNKGRPF